MPPGNSISPSGGVHCAWDVFQAAWLHSCLAYRALLAVGTRAWDLTVVVRPAAAGLRRPRSEPVIERSRAAVAAMCAVSAGRCERGLCMWTSRSPPALGGLLGGLGGVPSTALSRQYVTGTS